MTDAEVRANRRRARALCLIGGAPFGLVGGLVAGIAAGPGIGAGVGAAVLMVCAWIVWKGSTSFALRVIRARPTTERECPGLYNIVEGLCPTFGVSQPELMMVDDAVPNACTLGSGGGHSVLVVTSGLVNRLGLIELEGVISHELTHVKRHDTVVSSLAVAVAGPLAWISGLDRLVHSTVGRGRELRADQVAVAFVRYPPGLRDALRSIELGPPAGPGSVFSGRTWDMTRWVWVDPMVGHRDEHEVGEIDDTAIRTAALVDW